MSPAERAELNRQGAKAAARGDAAASNPMQQPHNRPSATGEPHADWLVRLRAWLFGYERQSSGSSADASPNGHDPR